MRIVIDGRMYNESGIGRYIRNLISSLQIIDQENEYFILHLRADYDILVYRNNFHKVLADFRWYGISEQVKLLGLLKELKPDLIHFPHFNVPLLYGGKFIVTIHDLIHQHFRTNRVTTLNPLLYRIKQFGYKKIFNNAVKKSEKILVPSNFVKDLLDREWEVDKDKIIVTYEAVDDNIFKIVNKTTKGKSDKVMEKFNIKYPYIFYVGNAHPHKNVEGLIKTFFRLRKEYSRLKLVLAGNDHYFWQRIRKEFKHKDIIYMGLISDEELVALYKNAECFVMPSLEEGFGIPLLEAMACGCSVVSSNKGSLSEVGGDAAIYFDPGDKEDMGKKMDMVLKSEKKRKELIEKGIKRCRQFSWKKLAEQTLEVYLQCV